MRASIPSAHSAGTARVRSESQSSAVPTSASSPVLEAASASSDTRSGPYPTESLSNPCQAASPCGVMATEAVVQHRPRDHRGNRSQTARGQLGHSALDHLRCQWIVSTPGREHHRHMGNRRILRGLRDQPAFFDEKRRSVQLAGDDVGPAEEAERGLQVKEGARITRGQHLVSGQAMPALR